MMLEKESEDTN